MILSIFSCACWPYVCLLWKIFPSILHALCPFYYCCFLKIFTSLQNISLKSSPSGRLGRIIKHAVSIIASSQSLAWVFWVLNFLFGPFFLPSFKESVYVVGECVCVCMRTCVCACNMQLFYCWCHILSCCPVQELSSREGRGELGRLR